MSAPYFKLPLYYKLTLALLVCVAIVNLGLSGSLLDDFGTQFPTGDLRARTILLCFAATWYSLFGSKRRSAPKSPKTRS